MPGRGPAPKDPDRRVRGDSPRKEITLDLSADGELRGPDLPDSFILATKVRNEDRSWTTEYEEYEWPEATRRWWENWRKSAIAQTFQESDWDFLLETARLHAQFWHGQTDVAAELRLRVSKFGATPEDRLRLRINVTQTQTTPQIEGTSPRARDKYQGLRSVS